MEEESLMSHSATSLCFYYSQVVHHRTVSGKMIALFCRAQFYDDLTIVQLMRNLFFCWNFFREMLRKSRVQASLFSRSIIYELVLLSKTFYFTSSEFVLLCDVADFCVQTIWSKKYPNEDNF